MESQITKSAEAFVTELFKKELSGDYRYHNLGHTLSARDASLLIGRRYRLSERELELLELAALFHDTGFTKKYAGHEDASKEIAASFLQKENYPPEGIAEIKDLIEVTKLGVEPETLLQKILKDADFNTNGGTSYLDKADALRYEWKVFRGVDMDDRAWMENNQRFWEGHQFYTGEGLALFGEEKRKTLKKLNKELEKPEGKKDKGKEKDKEKKKEKADGSAEEFDFAINDSKSAQMMFKTTLRNQIDLTNIADNKANIMLSINSLLITLAIPTLATQLEKFPNLVYPAAALLTTCILSIVFATLATRPVKMQGLTNLDSIGKSPTNLFFFGNFFKMDMAAYKTGLMQVVRDETMLDNSIVADLFFLGKALGAKFMRLRTCYSVFMTGMIVTVLTFAVTFLLP